MLSRQETRNACWSLFVRLRETTIADRLLKLSRPWTRSLDSLFDDQVSSCAIKLACTADRVPLAWTTYFETLRRARLRLVVSLISTGKWFRSARGGWQVSMITDLAGPWHTRDNVIPRNILSSHVRCNPYLDKFLTWYLQPCSFDNHVNLGCLIWTAMVPIERKASEQWEKKVRQVTRWKIRSEW